MDLFPKQYDLEKQGLEKKKKKKKDQSSQKDT